MNYIQFAAGKKIIETEDLMAIPDEPFTEMRANKTGAAGYQYAHEVILFSLGLP
jgi:hypothetical protein